MSSTSTSSTTMSSATMSSESAYLVLEDGLCFQGISVGAAGEATGEICFNTSMVGYLEILSDPSYAGQIITMTYPQIGNYGVSRDDLQAASIAARGLVVHDICQTPSNYRSELSLPEFLLEQNVVAIAGIDTRALTRHIRTHGAERAIISTIDKDPQSLLKKVRASAGLIGQNLVAGVSTAQSYHVHKDNAYSDFLKDRPLPDYKVVAYDCGIKRGILRNLLQAGCSVTVVPWDTSAEDVLALKPHGVFFANGPGDPEPVAATIAAARALLGKVPIFGICLGNQMLGLAAGAEVEKLKFGHRGANHPVMNLLTRTVEITAQNHGFSLVFESLGSLVREELPTNVPQVAIPKTHPYPSDLRFWVNLGVAPVVFNERFGRIQLTHVNLNDGTIEGLRFLDVPAFSVQYHPEASPGPTDSHYLFTAFGRLMDAKANYLNIDISADRLGEWRRGNVKREVKAHA